MTCWIEDELHLEAHSKGNARIVAGSGEETRTWELQARPCNAFCSDGVHATVAFATDGVPEASRGQHCLAQAVQHHHLLVVKIVPAIEVTPDHYPHRHHYGLPAETSEGLVAWLVYFRERRQDGQTADNQSEEGSATETLPERAFGSDRILPQPGA